MNSLIVLGVWLCYVGYSIWMYKQWTASNRKYTEDMEVIKNNIISFSRKEIVNDNSSKETCK